MYHDYLHDSHSARIFSKTQSLSLTASGQPSYVQASFSPATPYPVTSGPYGFTVTFRTGSGHKITSTTTCTVTITASTQPIISSRSASFALKVVANCPGGNCVCSRYALQLQPNSGSLQNCGNLTSNLTVTWSSGEKALPLSIAVQVPSQLQPYFTYTAVMIATPADNVVIYQLTFSIKSGVQPGAYPLLITVQEVGPLDQVQKTITYQLTITS